MSEKKFNKEQGTVVAYHRYVQGIISKRLNSLSLGPGYVPCKIASVLLPLGLVFLAVGLFVVCLRPHHLYLIGVWPRFVGPFFVILFVLCFGAAVFFFDMAVTKSNKYRRKLRFQAYGQYGTKVVHESHIEREKMIKGYKSGTAPHRSNRPKQSYPSRQGANNDGYERTEDRRYERSRHGPGDRGVQPYHDRPYTDEPPPKYRERDEGRPRFDDRPRYEGRPVERRPDGDRPRYGDRPGERRPDDGRPRYEDGRGERKPRQNDGQKVRYDDRPRPDERPRYERPAGEKPLYEPGPGARRYAERQSDIAGRVEEPRRDEYAVVDRSRQGREEPRRVSTNRYDSHPERFYDEVPVELQEPADEHHVYTRRTAQPAERHYSERNIDEGVPPRRAHGNYEIQFDTDTQDSAV